MMSSHNTVVAADANLPAAARILCVEDDREIAALLTELLQEHGFAPRFVASAAAMHDVLQREQVDLIMLDVMLPGLDGFEVMKLVRASYDLPIVMLTARGDDADRIVGLELGADDYVVKPFNPRELVARIRALLRRSQLHPAVIAARQAPMTFDGWRIEPATRTLFDPDRVKITLTSAEFDILLAFCRNAGRVLSREQLLDLIKPGAADEAFDRSVDVHVSRLRQKIEPDPRHPRYVKTVRGAGYLLPKER